MEDDDGRRQRWKTMTMEDDYEEHGPNEDKDGGRGQWLSVCSEYPEAAADQWERTQALDKPVQLVELLVVVIA